MGRKIDLTGQRFGKWTVIGKVEDIDKFGNAYWKCVCECGVCKNVIYGSLRSGKSTSCGCSRVIDLTGKRFGNLVVVKLSKERDNRDTIWECLCDCGREKTVTSRSLKVGNTRSCGCLIHKHIEDTHKLFEENSWKEGTSLNQLTMKIASNNSSGTKGVSWNKRTEKWISHMKFKGEIVLREEFENKQDAIDARKAAEEKYFKPILEKYGKEI